MPRLYQNPEGLSPYTDPNANFVWMVLEAIELEYQTTYSRRGGGISRGAHSDTFKFLLPASVAETISHDWSEYESVASRLANKIQSAAKTGAEISAGGKAAVDLIKKLALGTFEGNKGKSKNASQRINRINEFAGSNIKSLLRDTGAAKIPQTRIDSPLVYTNSTRREWSYTFTLVSTRGVPEKEVVKPIKELMRYSSPEIQGGVGIGIKLPFVFRLSTSPGNLIVAENAALVSVQPSWMEPYKDGFPMRAEVTLTFKDMAPLYRSTLDTGGIVNVINPQL